VESRDENYAIARGVQAGEDRGTGHGSCRCPYRDEPDPAQVEQMGEPDLEFATALRGLLAVRPERAVLTEVHRRP
jgi:hypothetical protein